TPPSTLFPYTTLFRSNRRPSRNFTHQQTSKTVQYSRCRHEHEYLRINYAAAEQKYICFTDNFGNTGFCKTWSTCFPDGFHGCKSVAENACIFCFCTCWYACFYENTGKN